MSERRSATRRAVGAILAVAVVVAAVVIAVTRLTGGDANGYLVRAVFLNSSFVTPGEQVKVAGVTVGTIHAVQLTADNRAAVVLDITNRRFTPFRADAHCEIGLESLLGEQYVQCLPTQPRAAGRPAPRALPVIHGGAGNGEHLLPTADTTTPVGFDLLLDMNRLPLLQRMRLLISGLGVGLAGNGEELNLALQRADPTLQKADGVIRVLADQNRVIARLVDDSDRVLAPLAAQRDHLGGFIARGGAVAATSASEARAIEANLHDLPAFLHQLGPAAARLNRLAGAAAPTLAVLRRHAAQINTAVTELGPLAGRATPALTTLGRVAQTGTTVFPRARRTTEQLLELATPLVPVAGDIASTASSFDHAGGIEDVMRFIYYYTGAVNGEDSMGHYVRTLLELANCSARSPREVPGCSADFKSLAALESPDATSASDPTSVADATPAADRGPAPTHRPTVGHHPPAVSTAIVSAALHEAGLQSPATSLRPLARYLLGR